MNLIQIHNLIFTDSAVQSIQFVPFGDNTILNLNVGKSDTDVSITIFSPDFRSVIHSTSYQKGVCQ